MVIREPFTLTDPSAFFLQPASPNSANTKPSAPTSSRAAPPKKPPAPSAIPPALSASSATPSATTPSPPSSSPRAPAPALQPKKSAARSLVIALRKQNHSVYEISEALKAQKLPLSPTAVREVLKAEGFAACPAAWMRNGPSARGPRSKPVADVRAFSLAPRQFFTTLRRPVSVPAPNWLACPRRLWPRPPACPVPK